MYMPHFFGFFLTVAALVLLILITFSTPFITKLFFLQASPPGIGVVDFGLLGWCLDDGTQCTPKALGIDWSPELIFWLTKALVVYPIAAGFTFLALVSLIPPLCTYRRDRSYPSPMFTCLSFLAFLASLVALAFTLALFVIGERRFHANGIKAKLGPCVWMSVGATVSLLFVTMSTGCGCVSRTGYTRTSPFLAYTV